MMEREIVGFHQDEEGHWVAELDCHHNQHMRHDPPLISRPWVLTGSGRLSRLGQRINCPLCEQLEWPEGLEPYQRTPEFNEQSTPAGLYANHATKKGVWGKLHILEGSLRYVVDQFGRSPMTLTPYEYGIIPPQVTHHIETPKPVRFYIEFYQRV